jgi:short-subunit dehydrogenase
MQHSKERIELRSYRALITGATSGIGAAFAEELPVRTDLLLTGRDTERLSRAAERLARPGRTIETHAGDLTDACARDRLVEFAEAFGVDLLINNAGTGRVGRFLDSPPDTERETVLLNVVAVVDLTRRLLPGMLQRARTARRRAGLIIVSSTAAFAPVPFFAAYAASKVFDLHFAEALAEEFRGEPSTCSLFVPARHARDSEGVLSQANSRAPASRATWRPKGWRRSAGTRAVSSAV